ncbi:MAG: NUDIX hydrolase [Brevundimonas sp.]|uniref:NUDIX hydrolase n=1 Tax=Brevundimonas sp. TaxID=1871086 RepID=UPI00391CE345
MLRRIVRALGARRRKSGPQGGRPSTVQSGAIPYAWSDDEPTYLLITSRRTGRWIFPKGVVEPDMTPSASAAKEAWEEAGVRGLIDNTAVGTYRTEKVERHSTRMIAVDLYPLRVDDQAGDWPERRSRRRHWATHRQARRLIDNPELLAVLDRLHENLIQGAADTGKPGKRRRQPRKRVRTR